MTPGASHLYAHLPFCASRCGYCAFVVEVGALDRRDDYAAALRRELAARHVALKIVEAHASLRELLRASGLEEQVGYLSRRASLEQAVEEFERRAGAAPPAAAERI